MALADDFSALYDSSINPNVQTVTYTPYGGTAVSVPAIVMRGGGMRIVRNKILDRSTNEVVIQIQKSDLSTVDEGRDTITLAAPEVDNGASHTYLVSSILGNNQLYWQLGLDQ